MNTIAFTIKILSPRMGTAEKKVAEFILKTPKELIPLSITQLAKQCGVSEATITRISKKLGFEGYQQLKLALAQETGISPLRTDISDRETPIDIFAKICDDIYYSLENTNKTINADALLKTCNGILVAKEILIFGLGNSAAIASDAAHKMIRLGLNAHAYTDNHMQAIVSSHATKDTLAIGISHSGSSKDIIHALKLCKENGATTVCLTNYGKSPIYRVSDYVLNTVSDETNYTILGLNSRISQLAIIDTIYSYLVLHLQDANGEIRKTEKALQSKKY